MGERDHYPKDPLVRPCGIGDCSLECKMRIGSPWLVTILFLKLQRCWKKWICNHVWSFGHCSAHIVTWSIFGYLAAYLPLQLQTHFSSLSIYTFWLPKFTFAILLHTLVLTFCEAVASNARPSIGCMQQCPNCMQPFCKTSKPSKALQEGHMWVGQRYELFGEQCKWLRKKIWYGQ